MVFNFDNENMEDRDRYLWLEKVGNGLIVGIPTMKCCSILLFNLCTTRGLVQSRYGFLGKLLPVCCLCLFFCSCLQFNYKQKERKIEQASTWSTTDSNLWEPLGSR